MKIFQISPSIVNVLQFSSKSRNRRLKDFERTVGFKNALNGKGFADDSFSPQLDRLFMTQFVDGTELPERKFREISDYITSFKPWMELYRRERKI